MSKNKANWILFNADSFNFRYLKLTYQNITHERFIIVNWRIAKWHFTTQVLRRKLTRRLHHVWWQKRTQESKLTRTGQDNFGSVWHDFCGDFCPLLNKTDSCQCTRAVWSTFAEIRSIFPGALIHYSGLEFHFKVQSSEVNPDSSPCLHRSQNARGRPTYIYPMIEISENTRNPSACRSFETKDYWTFSRYFFALVFTCTFSECVTLRWPTTATAKANHSREKQITHGKTVSLRAKANSVTAKANSLTAKAIRSRQKQIALGKNKFTHGKLSKSTQNAIFFIADVSLFSKCCYSSQ